MMHTKTKNKSRGFTILETLVAISIILLAITGPIDIIAQALKASYYSRDEVTAFYLAQEAIEYARNQRDNNVLNPLTPVDEWLVGVISNTGGGSIDCLNIVGSISNKCSLTQNSSGIYTYSQCIGTCPVLKKSVDGVYGSTDPNADDTNFTREIYFTKVLKGIGGNPEGEASNEVLMTVNIYWTNVFGSDNKFTLNTHLYNWKLTR